MYMNKYIYVDIYEYTYINIYAVTWCYACGDMYVEFLRYCAWEFVNIKFISSMH